jgi:thiamine transport system substrate-binding protein
MSTPPDGPSGNPESSVRRPRRRAGGVRRTILALAVALLVLVSGYAAYAYVLYTPPAGTTVLVVYSYPSLLGGTDCGSPLFAQAFGPFEAAHHVRIQVECPPGTLASTLIAEKTAPGADLVLGLDEITAPEAEVAGVLIPYNSPQLTHVSPELVSELSPGHAVTPYEDGFLAIDYSSAFANATHGAVAASAFPDFATNSTWASNLMVEDPTTDITGEEFLLWEIEFYAAVLHQDWVPWWVAVAPSVRTAPDWSTAFTEFTTPPNSPAMVASYATDPAYAVSAGTPGAYNATVSTWNGSEYGWRTVYGVGIVNGSRHLSLDQEFVDWFLSGDVQSLLPLSEWEYPANQTVGVPPVFASALNTSSIRPLNDAITPAEIAAQLPGWLAQWQTVENADG